MHTVKKHMKVIWDSSVDFFFLQNDSLKINLLVTEAMEHVEGSEKSDVAVNLRKVIAEDIAVMHAAGAAIHDDVLHKKHNDNSKKKYETKWTIINWSKMI